MQDDNPYAAPQTVDQRSTLQTSGYAKLAFNKANATGLQQIAVGLNICFWSTIAGIVFVIAVFCYDLQAVYTGLFSGSNYFAVVFIGAGIPILGHTIGLHRCNRARFDQYYYFNSSLEKAFNFSLVIICIHTILGAVIIPLTIFYPFALFLTPICTILFLRRLAQSLGDDLNSTRANVLLWGGIITGPFLIYSMAIFCLTLCIDGKATRFMDATTTFQIVAFWILFFADVTLYLVILKSLSEKLLNNSSNAIQSETPSLDQT
jgi:hypothetical protein